MASPALRVSSWKRPSVRPSGVVPPLAGLHYSPPSCPNFIIGIRAPCFCEGNLLRPAPPASLLLADNPLPSCFPSVRPPASAALDVPDPASQARAPVSPSALSPQIRTCQTFFLDSSCDWVPDTSSAFPSAVPTPNCVFLPGHLSSPNLPLWNRGPLSPSHVKFLS